MKFKDYAWISILFGSLWGLSEVTLGYALHYLMIPLAGFIMFPIGYYFLRQTYRQTNNIGSVFLAGIVTASIKLTNFYFPFILPIRIINPAIAIILETVVVLALYGYGRKKEVGFAGILGLCVLWRVAFIAVQAFELAIGFGPNLSNYTLSYSFQFFILESLINAGIIYLVLNRQKIPSFGFLKSERPNYGLKIISVALFAATVCIQFALI